MNPPDGASVSPSTVRLGTLTARALRGAWRATPPTLGADELELIAPHLLATGTAGLAWWAIKDDEALNQAPPQACCRTSSGPRRSRCGSTSYAWARSWTSPGAWASIPCS